MLRALRIAARLALAGLGLLVLAGAVAVLLVRGSLPPLEGRWEVEGIGEVVQIQRDAAGVPTLLADQRADLAYGLGFVHGQDRFFSMDLTRRAAAGELSALFGSAAVSVDAAVRVHRFRRLADQVLSRMDERTRRIVESYTAGVNAGVASLNARPFEYWLLRQKPRPWQPQDSMLVLLAMFLDLHDDRAEIDLVRGWLREHASPQLEAFLLPAGDAWEAPLIGGPGAPAPPPDSAALRAGPPPSEAAPREEAAAARGSNSWAVGGTLTEHGAAILANDMHLGLRAPGIWYRARGMWNENGQRHDLTGVTLPGSPAFIIGSNRFLAWGFTNSYGDWLDWVELEVDADGDRYRTPDGWRAFEVARETIEVAGGDPVEVEIRHTVWGPVIEDLADGVPRVLRWVAHSEEGVNLRLLELETIHTLEAALDLAPLCGIPAQNLVVAHRDGSIGWTLMGRVPRRVGFDGRVPVSFADGTRRWEGWLDTGPRVVNPPDARIWTANARVVDLGGQALYGDGGYAQGARAQQIRDGLRARDRWTEPDLLALQLDDRAVFLERWRELLLAVLEGQDADPEARELLRGWEARASTTSVGYRMVRAFRHEVHDRLLAHFTAGVRSEVPAFPIRRLPRRETPVWTALRTRAEHLRPPGFASWDAFLLDAWETVAAELRGRAGTLAEATWGAGNVLAIRHPMSRAVPALSRWLDMERVPVAGDTYMPRVQGPAFGASERMVVAPGHEERGILHLPTGSSGHFWSPFYRAGHDAWVRGEATPFWPGPERHTLELWPAP